MKNTTRLLLIACLGLSLAACKKEDTTAATAPAEAAPLAAPTGTDDAAWKAYLQDAVTRNMGNVTNSPFVYYLPAESDPDFQGRYERQAEQANNAIARGVTAGNLIAFGSPASAKMADLVVGAFAKAQPDTFKGVRVLFIGAAADKDRVQAAVAPSGAEFVFVETK